MIRWLVGLVCPDRALGWPQWSDSPPLDLPTSTPRIDGVRASERLSMQEADDLAERDAVRQTCGEGCSAGHDYTAACAYSRRWRQKDAPPVEVVEPDRLARKWCAYHFEYVDPVGGVDVVSHAGPAAGCTWCCASCLARATVVGGLRFERGDEPLGPMARRMVADDRERGGFAYEGPMPPGCDRDVTLVEVWEAVERADPGYSVESSSTSTTSPSDCET